MMKRVRKIYKKNFGCNSGQDEELPEMVYMKI